MSIGPKTTVKRSCAACDVCQGEPYHVQGDSGVDVYCAHPGLPERKFIGDSVRETPNWCPAEPDIAARADAEIAALRTERDQWREELRIYRETESADAARLDWFRTLTEHKLARKAQESGCLQCDRIGQVLYWIAPYQ